VTSFVFGTRLTNISRYLRHRDVDVAMGGVSDAIADWSGRHGESEQLPARIQSAMVAQSARTKRGLWLMISMVSTATSAKDWRRRWSGCTSRAGSSSG